MVVPYVIDNQAHRLADVLRGDSFPQWHPLERALFIPALIFLSF